MIYILIVFIFGSVIVYYRKLYKRAKTAVFETPCGYCFKHAAYERLQDRKQIIKTAYILFNEIPPTLYSSHRKRAIAEEACKKFYTHLKDNLEKI